MPPREDLILFLDLETTGSDRNKDEIIEIGMSMVDATQPDFPEIGSFQRVILPSSAAFLRLTKKKVVYDMHTANGLLDDIMGMVHNPPQSVEELNNQDIHGAQQQAIDFIDSFVKGDTTHIPYGGSGVLHFDGPFMEVHVPRLRNRLSYWAYDVGPIRRLFQKAGVPYASFGENKTHRALDDARVHADEFRWYVKHVGEWSSLARSR